MAFISKVWKDRRVQYPGRRTLTDVSTHTAQNVDVTRNEGTITEPGDGFTASNMNDLESRIAAAFTAAVLTTEDLSSSLTNGTGFSLTSKKFYRYGRIYMISCNVIPTNPTSAGTRYTIGSIPSEMAEFVWCPMLGNQGSHAGRVYLNNDDGKLMFDCAESVVANVNVMRMTMVWIKL